MTEANQRPILSRLLHTVEQAPWRAVLLLAIPALAAVTVLDAAFNGVAPYFNSSLFLRSLLRGLGRGPFVPVQFIYGQTCLGRLAVPSGAVLMFTHGLLASRILVEAVFILSRPKPLSYVREKLPVWSSLRAAGNSRVLRSSYLWIVFVPIVAKVFSNVDAIAITVGEQGYHLSLTLPFSWTIFFYSAVLTSIANAAYSFFCPHIIKGFDSPEEFKSSGRSVDQLRREFVVLLARWHRRARPEEVVNNVREFVDGFCKAPASGEDLASVQALSWNAVPLVNRAEIQETKFSDAFWFIRQEFADRLYPIARGTCAVFYLGGFLLIGWLLLSNIKFVVSFHLCPNLLK